MVLLADLMQILVPEKPNYLHEIYMSLPALANLLKYCKVP